MTEAMTTYPTTLIPHHTESCIRRRNIVRSYASLRAQFDAVIRTYLGLQSDTALSYDLEFATLSRAEIDRRVEEPGVALSTFEVVITTFGDPGSPRRCRLPIRDIVTAYETGKGLNGGVK